MSKIILKAAASLTPIADALILFGASIEHRCDNHEARCDSAYAHREYQRKSSDQNIGGPSHIPRMNLTANRAPKDLQAACDRRATAHTKMLMLSGTIGG